MSAREVPRWPRRLEALALLAAAAAVCAALAAGSARRHYDVDEIQHVHVMWRIAAGDRPFHDFVESHPPFLWYLGAPIVGELPRGPAPALGLLRVLATLAGLAFVALVLLCVRVQRPELPAPWLAAGGLLVLSHPRNLDYFIEARPDSFAHALLFGAWWAFLRGRPGPAFRRYATFAFLAAAALLCNPKLAALVALFSALDLWWRRREGAPLAPAAAGHAAGLAAAVAAAVTFLSVRGIDPLLAWDLSIGFHQRFLATTAFSRGLAGGIAGQPVPLALVGAGAACWLGLVATGRLRPRPLELALALVLAIAPWVMPLPYKQYFTPWFVLAAAFVPFLGLVLGRWRPAAATAALVAAMAIAAVSAGRAAARYRTSQSTRFFQALWARVDGAAAAGGRIVTHPQWHPVNRRDVFYAWFVTWDPAGRGQDVILREWNPRGFGRRFTADGYREDLERYPPALIVTVGEGYDLPATQEAVVAQYVRDRQAEYRRVPLLGRLGLLVRRDQALPPHGRGSGP
jgi:hypothetical protein